MNSFCPGCGTKIEEQGTFCINCGYNLSNSGNASTTTDNTSSNVSGDGYTQVDTSNNVNPNTNNMNNMNNTNSMNYNNMNNMNYNNMNNGYNNNMNYGQNQFATMPQQSESNVLAIIGFIGGIISLCCCCYTNWIGIASLILSILGLNKSKEMNGKSKGLAIAGIVMSGISLASLVIVVLLYFLGVFAYL